MTRRQRWKPATGVLVAGLVLVGCAKTDSAASGSSAAPSAAADVALHIPLGGSVPQQLLASVAGGGWAIVPMGDLDQADNTFWQVFATSPPAGGKWSLATPQGVADNGGLAIATGAQGAVVGVDVSQDLGFSPLASTVDEGKTWSPEVLPQALTPVPDALASGAGDHLLALVGRTGSTILNSENGGASTKFWGSMVEVAAADRQVCHVRALTALTYGAGALPVTGALCGASADVGVYQRFLATWQWIGGPVPAAALAIAGSKAGSATEVLRVWASGTTMLGLAEAVSSGGTSCLFGFRRTVDRVWMTSSVLALTPTEHLVATGYGPDGSIFVLARNGSSLVAELLSAGSFTWSKLPAPPVGTQTLEIGPGGSTEALVVDHSTLTVDDLGAGGWATRQVVHVPIQYGSSA